MLKGIYFLKIILVFKRFNLIFLFIFSIFRSNCQRHQTGHQRKYSLCSMDHGLLGHCHRRLYDFPSPVEFGVHFSTDSVGWRRCNHSRTCLPAHSRIQYRNYNNECHCRLGSFSRPAAIHFANFTLPLFFQRHGYLVILPRPVHAIPNPNGKVFGRNDSQVSLVLHRLFDTHVFHSTGRRFGLVCRWNGDSYCHLGSGRHHRHFGRHHQHFATQKTLFFAGRLA